MELIQTSWRQMKNSINDYLCNNRVVCDKTFDINWIIIVNYNAFGTLIKRTPESKLKVAVPKLWHIFN